LVFYWGRNPHWSARSQALLGKHAGFIFEANRRGRPIDFSQEGWRDVLIAAVDALVSDTAGDQGSNNLPAAKGDAAVTLAGFNASMYHTLGYGSFPWGWVVYIISDV
jgi:hypothetical protein